MLNPRSVSRLCLAVITAWLLSACQPSSPPFSEAEIAANNRGVGLMGQYRNEDARHVFAELLTARPDWLDVEVNLAIATLNRQQENDELVALEIVERVLENHPDHQRARYIAGLMRFYIGENERALVHFQTLREAVPDDAHLAYFTAQTLAQLGQPEAALALYQHAIEQDPYLRSSYYGAALILRQLGDAEAAREQLALYQRFANNPRAQLAEFRYTRKGPLAEALAVSLDPGPVRSERPSGELFAAPIQLGVLAMPSHSVTVTTADLSGDGLQDLFVTGGPGHGNQLWQQTAAGFRSVPHPLVAIEDVMAVAWGDLDNGGDLEAYLCRDGANSLRAAALGWAPAAGSADVADATRCRDVAVFDADHDGDLDIFVVSDGHNELFNNNLDGSFRRLSLEADPMLAGASVPSRQVLPVDLDGDRILDVIVLNAQPPHQVLHNDRLWQYRPADGFEHFIEAPLVAVVAVDPTASGQQWLMTADQAGQVQVWQPDELGQWRAETLLTVPAPVQSLLAMDLDGNGRPELLVQHAEGVGVWAFDGQTESLQLRFASAQPVLALTPIVMDATAGPALAVVVDEGPDQAPSLWLWPPGEGRYGFVSVQASGMTDAGEGMRSNASGLGTRLVARVDQRWSLVDQLDPHSAAGQSLQPVALGLGDGERIDFLKLFWSDGVLQTELALAPGPVHRISELQRQLASCPVLFAWNGERFDFVSDLLGVGGIGFFQQPGVYAEPRPWEFFVFPEGSIAPRDGRYELKISEPMEEIAYIDTASLHIHDLPPGWGVTLNERMYTGSGPMPDGAPVFYRLDSLRRPMRAINQRGEDVTAAILEQDHVAADPGPRDRRFLGRLAEDHVLTLEFDGVINPPGSQPVMVAYGWVEYPYSQTVFAAWQANADYRPPSLYAYADGHWQLVHKQFGYPAGMPREMSMSLEALPPETTALRLAGNWEVYWDRVAVVDAQPAPAEALYWQQPIIDARMAKTGFARRDTLTQQLPYYDYNDRSPFWDTMYPTGYYTSLGPVEPLVVEANNALAIIGPGEELHLGFAAPPPVTAEGWQRRVVLEVRGFAKDMDLYTLDGETVGPLPYTDGVDSSQRESLHARFLKRFQGGF